MCTEYSLSGAALLTTGHTSERPILSQKEKGALDVCRPFCIYRVTMSVSFGPCPVPAQSLALSIAWLPVRKLLPYPNSLMALYPSFAKKKDVL